MMDDSGYPQCRFIPTCVGNTELSGMDGELVTVHPHLRGEYVSRRTARNCGSGSSPLAWGIHLNNAPYTTIRRFIPTCVGNTPYISRVVYHSSVHPHLRGEYGKCPASCSLCSRFIPTCVGNTADGVDGKATTAVHPHLRGEYDPLIPRLLFAVGSSPLAWGIPLSPE